jgi:hypothetical protein
MSPHNGLAASSAGLLSENRLMGAGPGPLWPWRGISAPYGIALVVALAILLGVVPIAWVLVSRRFGRATAGPLWPLVLFELLALAYALVVPPWQKPDEPQHMVHVEVTRVAGPGAADKLLPGASRPPQLVAVDQRIEADIARSMRDTDAVRWLPGYGGTIAVNQVPGPTELPHPPLYYEVAALVSRPFAGSTVLARLAVVRALGVALVAGAVWCCIGAGAMLLGRRWSELPAVVALAMPAFALLAGAANNDVLAELLAAVLLLVLLVGVLDRSRLARPLPWMAAIVLLLLLGLFTKRTFIPLTVVAVVAVLIRLRAHARPILGAAAALLAVAALVVATRTTPRLALWQTSPTGAQSRCAGGHDGAWAICLQSPAETVSQRVALPRLDDLEGRDVRLWFNARSTDPRTALQVNLGSAVRPVITTVMHPDESWHYTALTGHVPNNPHYLEVYFAKFGPGTVQIDGVGLESVDWLAAAGTDDVPPSDPTNNQVVNGSAERAVAGSPRGLPTSVRRATESAVDAAAGLLYEPRDVSASLPVLTGRAAQTFSSAWATIAWQGKLPLFPSPVGWALAVLVGAGLAGFAAAALRGTLPGLPVVLLVVAVTVVGASVLAQTVPPNEVTTVSGRYLYTGLVAFTVMIAAGWRHLWPGSRRDFRIAARLLPVATQALFVGALLVPFLANGVRL